MSKFASKAALLAHIDSITLTRFNVDGGAVVENTIDGTITKYNVNVVEEDSQGGKVTSRNIGFYVLNEGLPSETAYLRDAPRKKNVVRDIGQAYLNTLVPATFERGEITTVNEEHLYVIARVFEVDVDTATEKEIIIYKPQGAPVTHKYFVRL